MGNEQRKPARMSFTNLENARSLEAQFNPDELNEILSVDWSELQVQGLSHKPHQYASTDNHEFSFKLLFNSIDNGGGALVTGDSSILNKPTAASGGTQNRQGDILLARNYLMSLGYGPRGKQDIIGSSPPRFLFVWPGLISLTCRLHSLKLKHTKFDLEGRPMVFEADVTIKECRDVRLFSDEVFFNGTFRSSLPEGDDS